MHSAVATTALGSWLFSRYDSQATSTYTYPHDLAAGDLAVLLHDLLQLLIRDIQRNVLQVDIGELLLALGALVPALEGAHCDDAVLDHHAVHLKHTDVGRQSRASCHASLSSYLEG